MFQHRSTWMERIRIRSSNHIPCLLHSSCNEHVQKKGQHNSVCYKHHDARNNLRDGIAVLCSPTIESCSEQYRSNSTSIRYFVHSGYRMDYNRIQRQTMATRIGFPVHWRSCVWCGSVLTTNHRPIKRLEYFDNRFRIFHKEQDFRYDC